MKWIEAHRTPISDELLSAVGGNPIVAQVLASRGITGIDQARAFLNPKFYTPSPPDEMPGMVYAVEMIENAIQKGEKIGVWGDFDVDGQTATTVLVSALKSLGADIAYHIPVRALESHGVNVPNLEKLLEEGVRLLVTCDTGIGAHEAALYARERGVKMVITDHHDLPAVLPQADAIINSKLLSSEHPLSTLPGVGVAYKLVEKLFHNQERFGELEKFLDLVALGIVADIAYLHGDTRYLLQRGLEVLRNTERLGLQILYESAEISKSTLTEEDISYSIAPRLNSLGRLGDANVIVDFLTSDQESLVRVMVNRLEGLNAQRKLLSSQVFQAAVSQLEREPSLHKSSAIILAGLNWPAGVVGIVANRLVERYHKPTVLLTLGDDGFARGSARSIPGCDISRAIGRCDDLLEGYGGHPMAAGLAIKSSHIEKFRERLSEEINFQLGVDGFEPELVYDVSIELGSVFLSLVEQVEILAPFGPGNPTLVFVANNIKLVSHSLLGRSEEHLKLIVEDETGAQQKVVWWQGAGWELPKGLFDLAFSIRKNMFRGEAQLQMELLDFRIIEDEDDINAQIREIKVVDYRNKENSEKYLEEIISEQLSVIVWVEGPDNQKVLRRASNELIPADTLVVWHSPPNLSNLLSVIEHVDPSTVYFFGKDPQLDDFESFITRLAGLCKYAIAKKDGEINLEVLASAMAHTETSIRLGLEWLENSEKISILAEKQGMIIISDTKGRFYNHTSPDITLDLLKPLLKETKSFRKYLMDCNSDELQVLICSG